MHDLQYVIGGQFRVATLIGLAVLCLFVWAAAVLTDVEPVKSCSCSRATPHNVISAVAGP